MEAVQNEKGQISIHTENIFPIIKKFLYSDHEIFLRELVSNAVDATQKLRQLSSFGEFGGELGDLKVTVSLNEEAKTITISDNGIGMTADEIVTKSYRENAEAARWVCDGSTEFELTAADRTERGSDIILHLASDSEEFLNKARLRGILDKYARFLPVPVEFDGQVVNNTTPIWTKSPSELTDEDYKTFYRELYPMGEEPLFWIHLNVDYPFNLTGILYFPRIKNELRFQREKIQLYSRQVFITDEVKDVVPDFLMMLHGVIDSPDIPLNVSRSFLQADTNVKKINGYITRKVADKLNDLFNADRKAFEEKFDDIGLFIKYGILSDEKFWEKAKNFVLLKNTEGQFATLDEYREKIQANQTDKNETLVFLYTSDRKLQDAYVESALRRGYDVLLMDNVIDAHFINALEQKLEKVHFQRVDADTLDKLIDKGLNNESVLSEADQTKLKDIFDQVLNNKLINVSVEAQPVDELPVTITQPEFMRRMKDMSALSGEQSFYGNFPMTYNLVINANHPLISKVLAESNDDAQKALVKQVYDLALLSQNMLTGAELTAFVRRTVASL